MSEKLRKLWRAVGAFFVRDGLDGLQITVIAALGFLAGAMVKLLTEFATSQAATESAQNPGRLGFSIILGGCILLAIFGVVLLVWIVKLSKRFPPPAEPAPEPGRAAPVHTTRAFSWLKFAQAAAVVLVAGFAGWLAALKCMPALTGETPEAQQVSAGLSQSLLAVVLILAAAVPAYIAFKMAVGSMRDLVYNAARQCVDTLFASRQLRRQRKAWQTFLANTKPIFKAIGWAAKAAFLLGLLFTTLTALTSGLQALMQSVQNVRLREQNKLIEKQNQLSRTSTLITVIDQQFQQEANAAEQAYNQIRDILLRGTAETATSSNEDQIFALRALPAAMRMRVTRAVEVEREDGVLDVERRVFLPNIVKLRPVLEQYLSMDRVGFTLARWRKEQEAQAARENKPASLPPASFTDRSLTPEEVAALKLLSGISTQIFLTLHELAATHVPGERLAVTTPPTPQPTSPLASADIIAPLTGSSQGQVLILCRQNQPEPRIDPARPLCLWNLDSAEGFPLVRKTYPSFAEKAYWANSARVKPRDVDLRALPSGLFKSLQAPHLDIVAVITFPTEANLVSAHLEGATFRLPRLGGAKFMGAHLEEAMLHRAHLEGADLTRAHLERANLSEIHLEDAVLAEAYLENAKLMEARLDRAILTNVHLEGADLRVAHLEGATLYSARLDRADLSMAYLTNSKLPKAHLVGSRACFKIGF